MPEQLTPPGTQLRHECHLLDARVLSLWKLGEGMGCGILTPHSQPASHLRNDVLSGACFCQNSATVHGWAVSVPQRQIGRPKETRDTGEFLVFMEKQGQKVQVRMHNLRVTTRKCPQVTPKHGPIILKKQGRVLLKDVTVINLKAINMRQMLDRMGKCSKGHHEGTWQFDSRLDKSTPKAEGGNSSLPGLCETFALRATI